MSIKHIFKVNEGILKAKKPNELLIEDLVSKEESVYTYNELNNIRYMTPVNLQP